MDRSFPRHGLSRSSRCWAATLLAILMVSNTGCISSILATGIYLWQGGNVVPAQYEELQEQRVIVVCRPPASNEYRHAGAARNVGKRISSLLGENVKGIDVVSPREVDNWVDEQDWENFKDLGRAVKADKIVYVELDNFDLYKGTTLYQGNAEVDVTVYDMNQRGKEVWHRNLGQMLFPRNSGIPSADKPVQEFERQFVEIVSTQAASLFYTHDPNVDFAMDAIANR